MPDVPLTPDELQRAMDASTLLPGEDPATTHAEDAVHWIRVYGELISVKTSLLDRAQQVLTGMTEDAVRDIDVDQRLLRAQAGRYRVRYEFWLERVTELASPHRLGRQATSPPHLRIEPSADDERGGKEAGG